MTRRGPSIRPPARNGPVVSVVIATNNRLQLVQRAVRSVLAQDLPGVEAIVVVDGSDLGTAPALRAIFPDLRILQTPEKNTGPGPARMAGVRTSLATWIAILDDDDELLPSACSDMLRLVAEEPAAVGRCVFQFAHGNGWLADDFRVLTLEDYLASRFRGDFVPLLRRQQFLSRGYAYPPLRIGAEGLLWMEVARREGVPTWRHTVGILHHDAPSRLTTPRNQMRRAAEYADYQELFLDRYGDDLARIQPKGYRKRLLAAGTYSAMAGRRADARRHARRLRQAGFGMAGAVLALVVAAPALARLTFRAYRRMERIAGRPN